MSNSHFLLSFSCSRQAGSALSLTNHGSVSSITMGTWRGLRVAFLLGSLFMILLIIVYWDDVGGFALYPLREPKQDTHRSDAQATTGPPHSASASSSFTASSPTPVPKERRGGAVGEQVEEEGSDKQEQRKETTREHAEEETSHTAVEGGEQEARKKRIMDMCSGKDAVEFPGRTRTFEQIPNRELDHLIVDDTHQIIYCFVPKVQLSCMCVCLVYSVSILKQVHGPLCRFLALHSGCVHQLEEGDGGSVSVSDLALLRKALHRPRGHTS